MKTLFIPAKIKSKVNESKILEISKKLPKEISLAYSIQYKETADKIKKILSKNHKIQKSIQVLGCSKPLFSKNTKAILLISSGRFHAISLACETKISVYILDHDKLTKISQKEIESFQKKQKASLVNFLNSEKIGILVSTKPGQQNLQRAIKFKKKTKNKKSYLFIANNLDINESENFGINCFVNTACSRMDMNHKFIINVGDVQ